MRKINKIILNNEAKSYLLESRINELIKVISIKQISKCKNKIYNKLLN